MPELTLDEFTDGLREIVHLHGTEPAKILEWVHDHISPSRGWTVDEIAEGMKPPTEWLMAVLLAAEKLGYVTRDDPDEYVAGWKIANRYDPQKEN